MTQTNGGAVRWLIGLVGVGSLLNAGWMLALPHHWYSFVPADVPDYGPYNPHLVKDLGGAFLVVGLMLLWAWRETGLRLPFTLMPCVFYGVHALIHVHDTGFGLVDAHHWLVDLPLTYLPAALLFGAVIRLLRRGEPGAPTAAR